MVEKGEYIRIKNTHIHSTQICKVVGRDADNHLLIDNIYDKSKWLTSIEEKESIIKHGKYIIDVLEDGDLVRYQVKDFDKFEDIGTIRIIKNEDDGVEEIVITSVLGNIELKRVKILQVLTLEQFDWESYRIFE